MFITQSDIVVIGGSAAGVAAAITAHRQYPDKNVVLLRKERQALIACGIPYIFGTIGTPEKNLMPDEALGSDKIKIVTGEATKIDTRKRLIEVDSHDTIGYKRLVIATGSYPAMPPIPGFALKNIVVPSKDMAILAAFQEQLKQVKDLIVIGGSFKGVELADECKKAGVENVTIVEQLPYCLASSLDEEFGEAAEEVLKKRGINLKTGTRVRGFIGSEKVEKIVLAGGEEIKADAVIISVGVVADVKLAKDSGLKLGATGAIAVDRYMKTSNPHIFACGDCAEKKSFFGGRPSPLKLESMSAFEARIAAANLFGTRRENNGAIGVVSTVIGDFALACAGLTANMAEQAGYDHVTGSAKGLNRYPDCMPGAENVKIKFVFERRTGVLLGGQLMGGKAVGEMINVVSACIQKKMTFDDIAAFQIGTHPALTASPVAYQLVDAAEMALKETAQAFGR